MAGAGDVGGDWIREGTVVEFDEDRGLGVVSGDGDARWPFHCTSIADGSRRVDPGAKVVFRLAPGHLGSLEARDVSVLGGATNGSGVVDEVLRRLVGRLEARDLEGSLALFFDDAVVFGSELGEQAVGRVELTTFFSRLFARRRTYGWTDWSEALSVGSGDRVIWFAAPAVVVVREDAGEVLRSPYRLSGVLERDGDDRWRFRLFNGTEPVAPYGS